MTYIRHQKETYQSKIQSKQQHCCATENRPDCTARLSNLTDNRESIYHNPRHKRRQINPQEGVSDLSHKLTLAFY